MDRRSFAKTLGFGSLLLCIAPSLLKKKIYWKSVLHTTVKGVSEKGVSFTAHLKGKPDSVFDLVCRNIDFFELPASNNRL